MAEQDGKKSRRRRKGEVDEQLAELLAKRDSLDVGKAERERVEQEALRRYAEARVQLDGIDGEAQRKVDQLRQQIEQVQQRAKEDRSAGETAQSEALATLNAEPVGRTADELARLFDLPIKRVRRMIRQGKSASSSATNSDPVAVTAEREEAAPTGDAANSAAGPASISTEVGDGSRAASSEVGPGAVTPAE